MTAKLPHERICTKCGAAWNAPPWLDNRPVFTCPTVDVWSGKRLGGCKAGST